MLVLLAQTEDERKEEMLILLVEMKDLTISE